MNEELSPYSLKFFFERGKNGMHKKIPPLNKKRKLTKEAMWAYLFILPTVIGLMIFYMLPALASFALSLTKWDGITTPQYIGLENIKNLIQDPSFIRSVSNTVIFTIVSVPVSVAIATLIAILLNQRIKGMVIYRTIYFLPVVTMPVAVGMIWKWLYNTEFGIINHVLGFFHLPQPSWLFDPNIALFSIILVYIWMCIGHHVVLLLAGLQAISSSYYEAAMMDGASKVRQLFSITLPLLSPTLFFVLITGMISSLQVFDLVFMMIGDSKALLDPMRTVVYGVYESGFIYAKMGVASAQAFLLFLGILFVTIFQFVLQKKWVHYDA